MPRSGRHSGSAVSGFRLRDVAVDVGHCSRLIFHRSIDLSGRHGLCPARRTDQKAAHKNEANLHRGSVISCYSCRSFRASIHDIDGLRQGVFACCADVMNNIQHTKPPDRSPIPGEVTPESLT
jgi:hypothetical protein